MKSERATVEEPSHSGGKSIQNILDNKSIRRTTTMTVGLLSTIWMIDMIDRVMIGLALPMIGDEFSLSNTQLGGVVSIFAIFYMLGQVPGGMLADRFGPRPLLIVALILWSVFTALTGFAWGLVSLMVMRAMFGLSQGLFPAASFKALAERTRPKTSRHGHGLHDRCKQPGPRHRTIDHRPSSHGRRLAGRILAGGHSRRRDRHSRLVGAPGAVGHRDHGRSGGRTATRSPVNTHAPRYSSPFRVWKFALLFCLANMAGYGLLTWVPSYLLNEKGALADRYGNLRGDPVHRHGIGHRRRWTSGGQVLSRQRAHSARSVHGHLRHSAVLDDYHRYRRDVHVLSNPSRWASADCARCRSSPSRCGALPAEFLGSGNGFDQRLWTARRFHHPPRDGMDGGPVLVHGRVRSPGRRDGLRRLWWP